MAELFTEEDVRRYADRLRAALHESHGCPVGDCATLDDLDSDEWTYTARAVLSALAEDGRLRSVDLETRLFDAVSALAELVRLKDGPRDDAYATGKAIAWNRARAALAQIPAESGGALPSDTPALVTDMRYPEKRPGWLGEWQTWPCGRCGKEENDAEPHDCQPVPDPVSVLEEETGAGES